MKHTFARSQRDFVTAFGVADADNAGIESFHYALNALGQRTRIDEGNGRVLQLQRDALNRLTQESISGVSAPFAGTVNYTMNSVGYRTARNSTQPSVPNQSFTLNANGDIAGVSYDSNGNTLSANGSTDLYDFEDRLIRRTNVLMRIISAVAVLLCALYEFHLRRHGQFVVHVRSHRR